MKISRPLLKPEAVREYFERKAVSEKNPARLRKMAMAGLWYLDRGIVRVFENGAVNVWAKEAILAWFKTAGARAMSAGPMEWFDKIPLKSRAAMKAVRAVPGSIVRFGAFVEEGAILMPSFVNVGARVGRGTMIDTWATVGSCAQVGANVHVSGGVGIGGVLEPAQAAPVIIEDGAFLGSRAIVVEGVRVGREAVLGAGVTLTRSTKIVDVRGTQPVITEGAIPERAVVIPGNLPKEFPAGTFGVSCALIIGTRNASTDLKTSLNQALRENHVAV